MDSLTSHLVCRSASSRAYVAATGTQTFPIKFVLLSWEGAKTPLASEQVNRTSGRLLRRSLRASDAVLRLLLVPVRPSTSSPDGPAALRAARARAAAAAVQPLSAACRSGGVRQRLVAHLPGRRVPRRRRHAARLRLHDLVNTRRLDQFLH